MIQFSNNINDKKKFQADPKYAGKDINELVRYNSSKIEDIGLTFTLPGYNDIELKRGGTDIIVNAENLDEYVYLVFNRMILNGPLPYIEAFKLGFNKVFPINTLKCFTSHELEEIICGCSHESWEYETLLTNILPNHGFDKNSIIYQGLLKIMMEMNNLEKKMFLLFVTGSPRLPLGGILL